MADDKIPDYPDVEKDALRSGSAAPPVNVVKHANDADEAMKAFEGHEGEILVLDEATNKRLLRKIDFNILPVIAALTDNQSSADRLVASMCDIWPQLPR